MTATRDECPEETRSESVKSHKSMIGNVQPYKVSYLCLKAGRRQIKLECEPLVGMTSRATLKTSRSKPVTFKRPEKKNDTIM
mmetsp:Transcript_4853/g.18169  ORF Transcript_4853/g.18169 Transcript_4853/m.18169 type:complete len:82 (+) Transcript_4853:1971-2216(+)